MKELYKDNGALPLQQIYYGAPGTGKSHKVNEITSQMPKENVFRTTFHPDSDYSTFVGCYKPTKKNDLTTFSIFKLHRMFASEKSTFPNRPEYRFIGKYFKSFSLLTIDEAKSVFKGISEDSVIAAEVPKGMAMVDELSKLGIGTSSITYEFVPQVFTRAYVAAWNKLLPASGTGTTHSVPVSPFMPASNSSSPFGDCSLADPLKDDFKYDLDGYTVSPLISKDEDLLKQIDSLLFPFEGYGCLGRLHDETTVVLSNQTPVRMVQKNREDLVQMKNRLQDMIANAKVGNEDFGILGQSIFDLIGIINRKLKDSNGELIDFEYSLLGEYRDGKVYLYVEAIKSAAGLSFEKLLAAVYVHEMMHAYFKTSEVVTEVEEAIVECCTLSFLDRFDAATGNAYDLNSFYKSRVRNKVFSGLGHYVFGTYLYEHQSLNWMDMYKGVRVNRSAAERYVCRFDQIYPFGEEEKTMRMLYGLLNGGIASVTAEGHDSTMEDRVALVIEEINRGNCAQIFGDIFQLLDRDKSGYSEYPILADKDLAEYLMYAKDENGEDILKNKKGIEGGKLCLPPNLSILATMNTSDQSLFPIDSAFKRRWNWKYVPISNAGKSWKICVNGTEFDWWSFVEKINNKIWDATKSEDKKLGYFFCKADCKVTEGDEENNIISADRFVGKVLFYVYNDVFKDYGFDDAIFKDKEDNNTDLLFQSYFKANGKPNEEKLEVFLKNLEVKFASEMEEGNEDNNVDEPEDENSGFDEDVEDDNRVSDTNAPYKVTFPDGEVICEGYGWDTYIATLRKIGLDKALPFGQIFTRKNKTLPLITDKRIQDQGIYKYIKIDGYYVLSGTDSQHRLLKRMNKDLGLGLIIE